MKYKIFKMNLCFVSAVVVTWICCMTTGTPSQAYVLPSQYIVKTWASKHAKIKSVRVITNITAYANDKPSDIHFKEILVYFPEFQVLRSWATDDTGARVYFTEKSMESVSPVSQVLLNSNEQDEIRILKARGIPILTDEDLLKLPNEEERFKAETESLQRRPTGGRNNEEAFWVIGNASNSANSDSQLWVEKDTFMLWRLKFPHPDGGTVQDFQFENYRFFRDFPLPTTINYFNKNNRVFVAQLESCTLNVDAASFKKNKGSGDTGFTDASKATSSSVKDLIRTYYDTVR